MILLRNFDFAAKYFDYESKIEISDTLNPNISGWYKFVNGLLSALVVFDNNLYFLYGEDKFLIADSHNIVFKRISEVENECYLVNGNDQIVRFSYAVSDSKLNISPFEYIDAEDFKWGEFIAKIVNDRERKVSFVANLQD